MEEFFILNKSGERYYNNCRRNSLKGMLFWGPSLFIIFIIYEFLEFGFSHFSGVLLLPIFLIIFYLFYYDGLILKGKLFSRFCVKIKIHNGIVTIQSKDWFFKKGVVHICPISDINFSIEQDIRGFGNKYKTHILSCVSFNWEFYVIPDFFDNYSELEKRLAPHGASAMSLS